MVKEDDPNFEEFKENEGLAIISRHWLKTVSTMEHLMNMMNMMYYFQKLQIRFTEFYKDGK